MGKPLLLALGGGVVSAVFFLSVLTGSAGALILAYLTTLPLFLVGLHGGSAAGLIAGAGGALVVALGGGATATFGYVVSNVLPAVLLVRQALLSRPVPDGGTEWYPAGALLLWLSGYGLALFLLGVVLAADWEGGLRGALETYLEASLTAFAESVGDGAIGGAESGRISQAVAAIAPGLMIISWISMVVINATLAQGALMRFAQNRRPPMGLADIDLPGWLPAALAAAGLAPTLLGGTVGFVALNVAIVLGFACFFVGLGVVHAWARHRPGRPLLLAAFYLVLLFFGWPVLLVTGLGVIEQWLGLRRRFAAGGRGQEDE